MVIGSGIVYMHIQCSVISQILFKVFVICGEASENKLSSYDHSYSLYQSENAAGLIPDYVKGDS